MKYLFLLLLLTGCTSVTRFNGTYPPVPLNQVKVILDNDDASFVPPCQSVQIAYIRTPYLWNSDQALKKTRQKAAEVGAHYIKVTLYLNAYNDAMTTATAYRCTGK